MSASASRWGAIPCARGGGRGGRGGLSTVTRRSSNQTVPALSWRPSERTPSSASGGMETTNSSVRQSNVPKTSPSFVQLGPNDFDLTWNMYLTPSHDAGGFVAPSAFAFQVKPSLHPR